MNLFNAATRSVSFWKSLTDGGDVSSKIALIYSGLASIPLLVTMCPKNLPDETTKLHVAGFNFML